MIMRSSSINGVKHVRRRSAAAFHAHPPPRDEGVALATAEVAAGAANLGSTVGFCDLRTNEREEYTLVPPDEADILHNRISTLSPIGRALFGRRVGETIEVDAPAGVFHLRVERVHDDAGRSRLHEADRRR
jgi:hypothetical protein